MSDDAEFHRASGRPNPSRVSSVGFGAGCLDALRILGHELRRPLTVIRGAATLLVDDSDALPPASRQQMLSLIDASASAMSDLIDDLLTATHLDLADVSYWPRPMRLAALVGEAVEAARLSPESAAAVEVRGVADLEVEVDHEHAVRALRALLVNADRYSPEGSPIEVVADTDGPLVRLEVRDRGPGIPPDQRAAVFEKFVRLDENTGGTGLGLFLARGLARGMGGDVVLRDAEHGGTVFCFTLKRRG